MPVYSYRCNECGQEFEYKQSMKDKALTVCPEEICREHNHGSAEVTRIISKSIGLVFKGSGFYLTDYKKKNSSIAAKDSGSSDVKSSEEIKTSPESKTTEAKQLTEAKSSAESKPSTESAKQTA